MKMDVYICKQEFKGVSFESYSADTVEDEYLIKLLLDYLEEKDIEVFERKGNVAATSDGWYGAFYKDSLAKYDKDTDVISKFIDNFITGSEGEE